MNKISSVIIDDEAPNRELIKSLVTNLNSNFIISGEAASVAEGYKLINTVKPALVFLDIKMQDGVGFDLLKMFEHISFEVVFITGFDEYALKAFDYNALDYILKPINLIKFGQTLDRVLARISGNSNYFDNLKKIVEAYHPNNLLITKIPVHHNDKVILLDLKEILAVEANDGCTCFYKPGNEKFTSSKQLSDFSFILDGLPNFIRITKGVYINLNFIVSYSKGAGCAIALQNGSVYEVSRRKKAQILETINQKKKTGLFF